jgi:hypothetical protein
MTVEDLPCLSRQDGSSQPVEKLSAKFLLQGKYMGAYGRLGEKELQSSLGKTAQFIHLPECFKPPDIHSHYPYYQAILW